MRVFQMLLLGFVLLAGGANAQYPNKPLKIIIPFAPGGASDTVGRIFQARLAELLGQPIVIENRAGASGNVGMEAAARSAPDGYTLYLGNVGTIAVNPGIYPKLPVNPLKDFIAVTQVVDVPGILVVPTSFAPNTVKEMIAFARASPGKLNFASPGSGSQNRLEMELLRKAEGLDMVHVPYKGGAGPAVTGLMAGETHMMFTTVSSALGAVKGGRLKALAVVSAKRLEQLPDVPTMVESGYPDSISGSWQGIFVPAGTSREIVERLYAVFLQTMKSPDVVERLAKSGIDAVTSPSPAAFAEYVGAETLRWGRAAKESGATAD
jgi:tripartite-type tricarboxylate transporter receptor subunit TctC